MRRSADDGEVVVELDSQEVILHGPTQLNSTQLNSTQLNSTSRGFRLLGGRKRVLTTHSILDS